MALFPYRTATTESVPCNQCGGTDREILHHRDRNGLPVATTICRHCGLLYLTPRMTAEWYGRYYASEYREQMARFKGKPTEQKGLFEKGTRHGAALANSIRDHWASGLTLEVGSSVGGVLNGVREVTGSPVLGIEPSGSEAEEANSRGIETICSLMETLTRDIAPAANILCTQSLNHLLDPAFFFRWAHGHLITKGRLVIEVLNFRHAVRHFGWRERAIQIDHTYMFVPEVLESFLDFAGFRVLKTDNDELKSVAALRAAKKQGLPGVHVLIVAEREDRTPCSDRHRIRPLYSAVRKSVCELPNSYLRFYWRFKVKRALRKVGL